MTGLNMESFLRLLRADLGAWASLGAIAVVLGLMTWTSWGSRRAIWKCLVLSVAVHVGLLLYGGFLALMLNLLKIEGPGSPRSEEVVERVRIAPVLDAGPNSPGAGGGKAARKVEAWDRDRGPLALADPALLAPRPEPIAPAPPLEAPKPPEPLAAEPVVAETSVPSPPPPEIAPELKPEAPEIPPAVAPGDPAEMTPASVVDSLGAASLAEPEDAAPRLRPDLGSNPAPRVPAAREVPPDPSPTSPVSPNVTSASSDRATPGRLNPSDAASSAVVSLPPSSASPARPAFAPPSPDLPSGPDLELPSASADEASPAAPRVANTTTTPATTLPDADIRRSIRPTREAASGPTIVPPRRLQEGATPIAMARVTPHGPTGIGTLPRPNGRRALSEVPPVYRSRLDPNRTTLAQRAGASAASEQAVERALDWLAKHQDADGRWDGGTAKYRDGGVVPDDDSFTVHCPAGDVCFGECYYWEADTALTGLSLLAYLGAGYTHNDGKYAQTVGRGLDFLLRSQKKDGDLRGPSVAVGMYCHAMATLALSEAYALTGDVKLRDAVEKGIGFLVRSRARDGLAWRYAPDAPVGDTSILGWAVMALKTGKVVGVAIPETTQAGTQTWLKKVSAGKDGGLARYQPWEKVTPTMTAEAWACRQFLGFGGPGAASDEAAAFLLQHGPDRDPYNIYYWYYGTLAMFQRGGDDWASWNAQVRDQIVRRQQLKGHKAGSWDPDESQYGTHGGRIYGTALATLTLEVYYRFLRLYETSPASPRPSSPAPTPTRPVDSGARRAGGGGVTPSGR